MNRVMLLNVCKTENLWLVVSATTLWPLVGSPCPIDTYCLNGGTCTYYETVAELVCQWVTHPLSLSLFSLTLSFIPLRPSPIVTLKTYASVVPCRELRQVTAKRPILLGWHHSAAVDGKILPSTPKPIETTLNPGLTQKETIFIVKHPQSNPRRVFTFTVY